MDEAKVLGHKTLLLEKAVGEEGRYGIITRAPECREDYWRNAIKALKGSVKHAADSSCQITLNNGSVITVLVTKIKQVPRFLKFDAVYFDGSYD